MTETTNTPATKQEAAPASASKGFAITSMVCGICALVFCWTFGFALTLSIVAIVFGIIALAKKKAGKGMAIAGLVTGGIGLVIAFLILLFAVILVGAATDTLLNSSSSLYNWL